MNIKKCNNCGWIYPGDYPGRQCRFCQTRFTVGYCARCKEWSDKLGLNDAYCTKCRTAAHVSNRQRHRRIAVERYAEWQSKIQAIKTPYRTLTEDEWLNACKHFGGCAYCGADAIDARSMFVEFTAGGRYCAWNIVPSCEACEMSQKAEHNPFMRMDSVVNRDKTSSVAKKRGQNLENLQRIVGYLQQFMEDIDDSSTSI